MTQRNYTRPSPRCGARKLSFYRMVTEENSTKDQGFVSPRVKRREAKRAAALRENLRKRKMQQSDRMTPENTDPMPKE